jgi:thiaminase/transcriptional activator TenA
MLLSNKSEYLNKGILMQSLNTITHVSSNKILTQGVNSTQRNLLKRLFFTLAIIETFGALSPALLSVNAAHLKVGGARNVKDYPYPDPDSLAGQIWGSGADIRQQALNTDFIQGIKNGTLNPDDYMTYNIQDWAYLTHEIDDLATAVNKSSGDIQIALKDRYDSYVSYSQEEFQQYNVLEGAINAVVDVKDAFGSYINFTQTIVANYPPQYVLVSVLPCEQLWPWLGQAINGSAVTPNAYSGWITGNADSGHGAFLIENFINNHTDLFDKNLSIEIFRQGMNEEYRCFNEAVTPQKNKLK